MNIAVIGEDDFIKGFCGIGLSVFPVEDTAQAEQVLDKLQSEGCALIIITETFAQPLLDKIDEISQAGLNVSIIPGQGEKKDITAKRMKKISTRAIGREIL